CPPGGRSRERRCRGLAEVAGPVAPPTPVDRLRGAQTPSVLMEAETKVGCFAGKSVLIGRVTSCQGAGSRAGPVAEMDRPAREPVPNVDFGATRPTHATRRTVARPLTALFV